MTLQMSEQVKEGILAEWDKGNHTVTSLARMYDLQYSTVYRWINESGRKVKTNEVGKYSARLTNCLAEVNPQLYELIKAEKKLKHLPKPETNTDDVVLALRRIEASLNKLIYAVYAVAYGPGQEIVDEEEECRK